MTIADDALNQMKPEPLAAVHARVRDGDILLCSGNDPFSRLIKWATRSPWSHVALAYRWPELNRIMVFESVQQYGVRAIPIERFCTESSTGQKPYPGQILLARHVDYADHAGKPGGAAMKRLADTAVDLLGDRFAPGEIAKIALRIALDRSGRVTPNFLKRKDEYICSEYAAHCLAEVGIDIPWDGRGFIAPADFALDPKIKAIAQIKT
ncbi:MAG TPA: hypothetical protein VMU59_15445 [Caulobacteraceae bacterium]|nr:hypothetical protein [Caulobacteraceae bacterium]